MSDMIMMDCPICVRSSSEMQNQHYNFRYRYFRFCQYLRKQCIRLIHIFRYTALTATSQTLNLILIFAQDLPLNPRNDYRNPSHSIQKKKSLDVRNKLQKADIER